MHNTFSYPKRKRQSDWLSAIVARSSQQNGAEVRRVAVRPTSSIESIDLEENNQGGGVERALGNQGGTVRNDVRVEIPEAEDQVQVVGGGDGGVVAKVCWHGRGGNGRQPARERGGGGCWVYIGTRITRLLDLCQKKCAQWATIIIEGEANDQHGPSLCLVRDYDMKYCCGACTYRLQLETTEGKDSWFWWAVSATNKPKFLVFSALSLFQSVCFAKDEFLEVVSGKAMYLTYAGFASNSAWFIAKCCAIYIYSYNEEMTNKLFKAMREYEKKYHGNQDKLILRLNWGRWSKLVYVYGILTVVQGLMQAYYLTDSGDVEDVILSSSYELSKSAYKWNNKNGNATDTQLKTEYGTNITPTTITMGIIVIIRDAAANIHIGGLLNSIVTLGIILTIYTNSFVKEVNELTPNVPVDDVEKWNAHQARREQAWERLESLANMMDDSNDIYETQFKILHVTYLLDVAFFITLIVYSEQSYISLFLFTIVLLTMMVWYILAGRIAAQNDVIQKWIHNWADGCDTIRINGVDKNVNVILHKLDKNPIGFGRGSFVINDIFHYKVLALVISVFLSIVAELSG